MYEHENRSTMGWRTLSTPQAATAEAGLKERQSHSDMGLGRG